MPDRERLVIFGCGGHARSVADVAFAAGYRWLLFVDPEAREGEHIAGHRVVASLGDEPCRTAIIAVGDNSRRAAWFGDAMRQGFALVSVIAPDATLGVGSKIAEGVFIGRGAHIGPVARIGRNVIVNTHAIVEHEAKVGAHSHIAVNAVVAGRCRVGARTTIGAGAVLRDGTRIGDDVVVGAGAVVVKDLLCPGVYIGCPARRAEGAGQTQ